MRARAARSTTAAASTGSSSRSPTIAGPRRRVNGGFAPVRRFVFRVNEVTATTGSGVRRRMSAAHTAASPSAPSTTLVVARAGGGIADVVPKLMSIAPIARSVTFVRRRLGMNMVDGEIVLPMSGYELVGVSREYTSDRIGRELTIRLEDESSSADFSNASMMSRARVITYLGEVLSDSILRQQYEEEIYYGNGNWYITTDEIPGAIILLLEDSKIDDAIEIGLKNIAKIQSEEMKADVALAIAISFYEKARSFMSADNPSMSAASEYLMYALNTLEEFRVTSTTGDEVKIEAEKLLRSIAPKCILEDLSRPLTPQYSVSRDEAMEGLQSILWSKKPFFLYPDGRNAFQNQALSLMTAEEQIRLFEGIPVDIEPEPSELYDASLAYMAQGFIERRPGLVERGARLLDQIACEHEGGPRAVARTIEVAMERGTCALLLGDSEEALSLLLDEWRADPEIKEYIYSKPDVQAIRNPRDRDFYGVCKLVEEWIEIKLLPMYRDTANKSPSLKKWFRSAGVSSYLKLRQLASVESLGDIVTLVPRAMSLVLGPLRRVASRILQAKPTRGIIRPEVLLSSGLGFTAPAPARSADVDTQTTDAHVENAFTGASAGGGESNAYADLQRSGTKEKAFLVSPRVDMYIAGIVGLLVLVRVVAGGGGSIAPSAVTGDAIASDPMSKPASFSSAVLSTRQIESIVRQWQAEKTRALGPKHDSSKLGSVLCGDMLTSWAQKAKAIQERGIWWRYQLKSMVIESVTQTARNRVVVVVKLEETAQLHGVPNTSRPSSYRSEYRARYAIVLKDGMWKIESGSVLADE